MESFYSLSNSETIEKKFIVNFFFFKKKKKKKKGETFGEFEFFSD